MAAVEFWFDFSCPFAYAASTQVEAIAKRAGVELLARPMLLGGVFRAREVPQRLFEAHGAEKTRHNADDIRRTAAVYGIELKMPAGHPIRTVEALRAMLVAGPPYLPLAHRIYQAYWVDDEDISNTDVLGRILTKAGHDAGAVLARISERSVKDDLQRRTDDAIDKGIFGAPSFIRDGELFYGADRMHEAFGVSDLLPVDFWYDYSSPYAYLASEAVPRLLPHARWRPMLLGAVFKMVGQVQVPLFEMSEAKRDYMRRDYFRRASRLGVEVSWPSRFPMNTVLALRTTLAAGEPRALSHRLFRAYWSEDRDIGDPDVVKALVAEADLDPAVVDGATDQTVKDALRASTDAAVQAGVFGAPTFVVDADEPRLFWGSDRVEWARRAASGDRTVW